MQSISVRSDFGWKSNARAWGTFVFATGTLRQAQPTWLALPPPNRAGYNRGMSGEQFLAVLIASFAAFCVWLVVRIFNRDRQAIWIAAGSAVPALVIFVIFAYILRMAVAL